VLILKSSLLAERSFHRQPSEYFNKFLIAYDGIILFEYFPPKIVRYIQTQLNEPNMKYGLRIFWLYPGVNHHSGEEMDINGSGTEI